MGSGQKLGCPINTVVIEGWRGATINTLAAVGGRGFLMDGKTPRQEACQYMALMEHIGANLTMITLHEMNGGTLRSNSRSPLSNHAGSFSDSIWWEWDVILLSMKILCCHCFLLRQLRGGHCCCHGCPLQVGNPTNIVHLACPSLCFYSIYLGGGYVD